MLNYRSARDEKENTETHLPEDEELRSRALWGVELYGPSEVGSLYASLKKLGWDEDGVGPGREAPAKWLSVQRMYGSLGSMNLGVIKRRGDKRFPFEHMFAPLPEEVDFIYGQIHQAAPSITALLICFVMKDEYSQTPERILRTPRRTRNERKPGRRGYTILGPFHAKGRDVKQHSENAQALVSRWFAKNLPGFFSNKDEGARLPTAELLTTRRQGIAGPRQNRSEFPKWARLVSRRPFSETWRLPSFPALSMTWDAAEDIGRFHTLLHLQTELLTEDDLKSYHGRDSSTYSWLVGQRAEGVLVHLGVLAGLNEIQRGLRHARDTFPDASRSSKQALKAIHSIKSYFAASVGFPTIASEMIEQSSEGDYFSWNCEPFVNEPWTDREKSITVSESLRKRTEALASRVAAQERETRQHFEQMSAILNAQETVRAQSRVQVLTIVATALTAMSLVAAVLSIEFFENHVNDFLNQRFGKVNHGDASQETPAK